MALKAASLAGLGVFGIVGLGMANSCVFTGEIYTFWVMYFECMLLLVEPGHTALKFSRLSGLGDQQFTEGWHLRIPYFERPIIFNTQTRFKSFQANTANRGRILYIFSKIYFDFFRHAEC